MARAALDALGAIGPAGFDDVLMKALDHEDGTVRTSVIAANHEQGLSILGADGVVEDTVVRDTQPRASDRYMGRGVDVSIGCFGNECDTSPAIVTLRRMLLERNHETGVRVSASEALVQSVQHSADLGAKR